MLEQSVQAKTETQQQLKNREKVSKVVKAHFKHLIKVKNSKDLKNFILSLRKNLINIIPYNEMRRI